jgi:hypothetical protein
LSQASFLTDVNLLAAADQSHDDTPFRDALGEFDEVLRLGLVTAVRVVILMSLRNGLRIEGPLGFVEHEDMLGRNEVICSRIALYVVTNRPDKCASTSTGLAQLVLKDLHKGTITAQKHCRSGRPTTRARNR